MKTKEPTLPVYIVEQRETGIVCVKCTSTVSNMTCQQRHYFKNYVWRTFNHVYTDISLVLFVFEIAEMKKLKYLLPLTYIYIKTCSCCWKCIEYLFLFIFSINGSILSVVLQF